MIQLNRKQIEEIASELEIGRKCFYNKKTGAIKSIIDFDSWIGADEEPWEEDLKELEENWTDYLAFENMESRDSFAVMTAFTEEVDDEPLREKLITALNRAKPFRNFKWIIDNSGDYRQRWFDFRSGKYIEWVEDQIEAFNGFPNNE